MLMMVEFGYDFKPTREQYVELQRVAPTLPEWKEADKEIPWDARYGSHLIDMELAQGLLADIGGNIRVKPFKNNLLLEVQAQFKLLERKLLLVEGKIQHNGQLMQVHVPNAKLIEFNEVTYVEDACTNSLQSELDAGWRIIAVCPPLQERRPTYILGRHNPERNNAS